MNNPVASEQSRLREKARLVRVWYNIDRRFDAVVLLPFIGCGTCRQLRNIMLILFFYLFKRDNCAHLNHQLKAHLFDQCCDA